MSVISRVLGAAAVGASVLLSPVVVPSASAAPCPDVEVVFARGTFEPPGVGETGQAFVDALRGQVGGKSVDVYPVNYPASLDFATAADGIIDATNKIRDMAASCPNTKMALGGYSQGAAVMAYATEDPICSPGGNDNGAHTLYAVNGMADQAADYAAHHLTTNGTVA